MKPLCTSVAILSAISFETARAVSLVVAAMTFCVAVLILLFGRLEHRLRKDLIDLVRALRGLK